jgi:hypothetical protein
LDEEKARISIKDLYGAGTDQFVLENSDVKVVVVPEVGGRIAEMAYRGVPLLHRTYPHGLPIGPYTEYGGIEECLGSGPGTVWNEPWKCDAKDDVLTLSAHSQDVLLQKVLVLKGTGLEASYKFTNVGERFSKFTFGIHPEISVGKDFRENAYYLVPLERGTPERGEYTTPGTKRYFKPGEGWCAVEDEGTGIAFGMVFPEEVVDRVEVYHPRVDSHMVMELLIDSIGLSPATTSSFNMVYRVEKGTYQGIRKFYGEAKKGLRGDYRELYERQA